MRVSGLASSAHQKETAIAYDQSKHSNPPNFGKIDAARRRCNLRLQNSFGRHFGAAQLRFGACVR